MNSYKSMCRILEIDTYGLADRKHTTDANVDPDELVMGIKVEMEHTRDESLAKQIALDHLSEISNYYTRLKKMEKQAGVE